MAKYYAVRKGNKTGIFTSWDECKEATAHFSNAEFKSFNTLKDADDFMSVVKDGPTTTGTTVYVDGSNDPKTGRYAFGAVIIVNGEVLKFNKAFENDEYAVHRNVAGEIKGAAFAIQWCLNHGIEEINLHFDYVGIEKWYTGEWSANTAISKIYKSFAEKMKNKIKVNFIKVAAHTGVEYNEMVDELAKNALGIKK